jgi:hypothetical protein
MQDAVPPLAARMPPTMAGGGLTPEQLREWADAQRRGKKVRRAAGTARFQGWSISIFAAFTIIFSLFDPPGLLLGIGMGITGYFQFVGAVRLTRLDAPAARMLGWNQLALGAMLVLYALWGLLHVGSAPLPPEVVAAGAGRDLGPMFQSAQDLAKFIAMVVYATVAIAAVLGQGWAAWYYFSREKYIRRYAAETPRWVTELQRAAPRT